MLCVPAVRCTLRLTLCLCRVNAVTCCILSSRWGFKQGKPADIAAPAAGNQRAVGDLLFDPSVLALWSGKLDPETGDLGSGMFRTTPNAAKYAKYLLASGTPALPQKDGSYSFVKQVFGQVFLAGFCETRVALRRIDGDVEPSMLSYTPEEVCFGPGKGTSRDDGDEPLEYFGTGWSTTMWAWPCPVFPDRLG